MASSDEPNTSLTDVAADLARRWATQRLAAVQAYGRILADYGQGRSSSQDAIGAYVKLAAEEAVRYPADAIGLVTDYASAVARQAGLELGVKAAPKSANRPFRDLELSGPLGGLATAVFVIDNPRAETARIGFAGTTFNGPSGETGIAPEVEPGAFRLDPGQEQAVTVSVPIDAAMFEAGARYGASLAITGFDDMVLRLRLTVLNPA